MDASTIYPIKELDTECTLEFSNYDMLALGAAEQAVIGLVISWGRKWGVKYAKVNN